jgi:sugar phosphate isomerase/epimerase
MVEAARQAGVILLHENEKAIYGAKPAGVKDLFATIKSPSFQGIFDPANFVEEDIQPYDDGWKQGLAELTQYFHIKDKTPGAPTCVPAGQGNGQIKEILADAKRRGFNGYLTIEPHMKAAGQFSGFTGPDLFAKAVEGLRKVCDEVGLSYE